ncbi:membrane fusion protein, multidrug efflux system [Franzmannia pantelleriensis]|uniref:Membrane fusion protein, multidrug efflux system n=1 Tax=Franzmannia pantelleriensis TaxID=48727 RepID=A0A1G9GRK3_9GAMM|nr:efflux RND transporter periplasmic adaptor subunit [Halomonas pantelleriensis]SDL03326.1 membrane fusion protein, multidrug efflux system [Halomonas pantelleriensis]
MVVRRPSPSFLLALACGLALLLWMLFGDLQRFSAEAPEAEPARDAELSRVEVQHSEAQPYAPRLTAQGQLAAWQDIELRARREGQIDALPVAQGERVEAGQTLLELDREDLPSQLARAEADLALARAELDGADQLRQRDLVSRIEQLRLAGAVAGAEADVEQLRKMLEHTRPAAPFAGTLDQLNVDPGATLQVGEVYARLVDDTQLRASAHIAQRDALDLEPGLPVSVRLLDGSTLDGELSYVASRADESTRSFAVEARLDNPDRRRLAGASASLTITRAEQPAHRLSPALLVLNEEGQLGVYAVDDEERVTIHAVRLLAADSREAWVTGLPERVMLITLGGGFVTDGQRVEPVPAEDDALLGGDDLPASPDSGGAVH